MSVNRSTIVSHRAGSANMSDLMRVKFLDGPPSTR